ncbi:beta-ketoacyl-[acyl-carrier-protein] synthase family protein [Rubrivivax rivuli]|uniref:Beta-ketoacyl-[acyl-carrier-protein] synthase family protein n=1 Tax=Rubrivivax rivuli TaxID=1862385 RepID=A0A437RE52_9BURK|nr:beta-ketoacyl-[acyl-carrier-protein] synthase family protein [Rubrivivax rivuli]RVU45040.1 beta-ketoacyl-[acyl-carrier-protein] synthase family protein [Rubrivivax rivuli]
MRRVVVTGMSVITPLGDTLDGLYGNLMAGRSGIGRWTFFDDERVYAKVGGDLSGYDWKARLESLRPRLPEANYLRARKLMRGAPFSTRLSVLASVDAWLDAGLGFDIDFTRAATLLAGHNLNEHYLLRNHQVFMESEPDWIDANAALLDLDTDHASSVSEVLGCRGASYTMGGACASANIALRAAVDEVRHHGHNVAVMTGAALEFSPMGLHAMALLGAITTRSFNDEPTRASRPYDRRREGFVPSHGTGTLILEAYEHARARGARIHGEVLGCVAMSDGNHLPNPSPEGQAATIRRLLEDTGTAPEQIDFVSAHATSTPLGDLSELRALRSVFGKHAHKLKINAPKSMLGHTCWSAPVVETIAGLLQMKHGQLHPSINVDELDPEVDLDICANQPVAHRSELMLKNSFGFGGINCCALWRHPASVA